MKHDERLPDTRLGAGLLNRLEDDVLVLPIRDAGAPSQPKRLDGQMGIKEKDESIEEAQAREGTEETVFIREKDETALGIPETIRDTELEYNLVRKYRKASEDQESTLPEAEDVFYYEASQEAPEGMPVMETEAGGYSTAYTWEVTEDVSKELMNDHVVEIDSDSVKSGELKVYDLEHMETEDGVIHFDRPTALLEPEEDRITVFRSGELQYQGDVEGLEDFLSEEYGWEMDEVDTMATAKVGARLDAYEEIGWQTEQAFINDEYMEALDEIGESFQDLPAP